MTPNHCGAIERRKYRLVLGEGSARAEARRPVEKSHGQVCVQYVHTATGIEANNVVDRPLLSDKRCCTFEENLLLFIQSLQRRSIRALVLVLVLACVMWFTRLWASLCLPSVLVVVETGFRLTIGLTTSVCADTSATGLRLTIGRTMSVWTSLEDERVGVVATGPIFRVIELSGRGRLFAVDPLAGRVLELVAVVREERSRFRPRATTRWLNLPNPLLHSGLLRRCCIFVTGRKCFIRGRGGR